MPEVVEHVTSQICQEKFWAKKKKAIKITIATAIILVILSLVGVVAYKELSKRMRSRNNILKRYGHLFVKVDDMASTEDFLNKEPEPVPERAFEISENCTLSCSATEKPRNDTEEEPRFQRQKKKDGKPFRSHGCCASYTEHFSPDTLPNSLGKIMRLVQFKRQKQRFLRDVCNHITNCKRGCTCKQHNITTQALVVDYNEGDDMTLPDEDDQITFSNARLELVEHRGFCKCYN